MKYFYLFIIIVIIYFIFKNNKIENFLDSEFKKVVIIPYRDREKHLNYFIENTIPLFNKYLKNYKVVVIEQGNNFPFNRGILINIGYDIFKDRTKYIITHDVDINPYKNGIKKFYNKKVDDNTIMGIYTSFCNTLGGIIKMKANTFKKINGFPNNFWGWGLEDIELQKRAETYKIKITKNIKSKDKERTKYFKIFNDVNDRKLSKDYFDRMNYIKSIYKKGNIFYKNRNIKRMKKHIFKSGLKNLKYKIIKETKLDENVSLFKVDFEYI